MGTGQYPSGKAGMFYLKRALRQKIAGPGENRSSDVTGKNPKKTPGTMTGLKPVRLFFLFGPDGGFQDRDEAGDIAGS